MTTPTEQKDNKPRCHKCQKTLWEAAKIGSYFKRVNPKGEKAINECVPSCEHKSGDFDTALKHAINGEN